MENIDRTASHLIVIERKDGQDETRPYPDGAAAMEAWDAITEDSSLLAEAQSLMWTRPSRNARGYSVNGSWGTPRAELPTGQTDEERQAEKFARDHEGALAFAAEQGRRDRNENRREDYARRRQFRGI